jgi:phosphohistidine phosphatase
MKTLFLLRHAKSSWIDPSLSDFDRPLNDRGRKTAPFMGKLMKDKGFDPAIILCSPAVRARQTAQTIRETGGIFTEVRFDDRIYEASPNGLLQVISEINDADSSAMLVGHNPGIEGFIRYLTGGLEAMPTAALAVIDLRIDKWAEVDDGCGTVREVYRPKELMT